MQAFLLISVIILRLSVKVKMHELFFVYVIIVSDLYFAILVKEHELGWLQQGRAGLSKTSSLCNTICQ